MVFVTPFFLDTTNKPIKIDHALSYKPKPALLSEGLEKFLRSEFVCSIGPQYTVTAHALYI